VRMTVIAGIPHSWLGIFAGKQAGSGAETHRYHRNEATSPLRSKERLKGLAYVPVPMIVGPQEPIDGLGVQGALEGGAGNDADGALLCERSKRSSRAIGAGSVGYRYLLVWRHLRASNFTPVRGCKSAEIEAPSGVEFHALSRPIAPPSKPWISVPIADAGGVVSCTR
jgi:hypothetical protein